MNAGLVDGNDLLGRIEVRGSGQSQPGILRKHSRGKRRQDHTKQQSKYPRIPLLSGYGIYPDYRILLFNLVAEPQYKGQLEELTAMLEKHLEGAVEGAMEKL